MERKEFLRELIRSLKRGRLHRLLKLLFIALFIYVSIQIGHEMFRFYLEKERVSELKVKGLEFHFGKVTRIGFKRLRFKDEKHLLIVDNGTLKVDLLSSLLKLKPSFRFIGFDSLKLKVSREKYYRRYFPGIEKLPVLLRTGNLDLKRISVIYGNSTLSCRRLYLNGSSFMVRGVKGNFNGKPFALSDISGKVENGTVSTGPFSLMFSSLIVDGRLKFNRELSTVEGFGSFHLGKSHGSLHIRKSGNRFSVEGPVNAEGEPFSISISGRVKRKLFLEELSIRRGNSLLRLEGSVDRFSLNLYGRLNLKDFRVNHPGLLVRSASGEVKVYGSLKSPSLGFSFSADGLTVGENRLKSLSTKGELINLERLKADFSAYCPGQIGGSVDLNVRSGSGKLRASFSSFDVKRLIVERGIRKHVNWIPEMVITGSSEVSLKGWRPLRLNLKSHVDSFNFKGYRAAGSLRVRAVVNRLALFKLSLKGKDGSFSSEGGIRLDTFRVVSYLKAESFNVSSLSFLKKAGLGGIADGEGRMWGPLRNPSGYFSFSSPNFSFQGEKVGEATSTARLEDYTLRFTGSTEDGKVRLESLTLSIRPKLSLELSIKASGVDAGKVLNVAERLKVHVPVDLKGQISGRATVSIPNLKRRRENLNVNVAVENFSGSFDIGRIGGNVSGVSGYILYEGEVNFRLSGSNLITRAGSLKVEGGKFSLSYGRDLLKVDGSGFSLKELKGSGRLSLLTDVRSRSLKGEFSYSGSRRFGPVSSSLSVKGSLGGKFDSFSVELSGSGSISSPYTAELPFSFRGNILEPEGRGSITAISGKSKLLVNLSGKSIGISGLVRDIELSLKGNRVKVSLALPELSITDFDAKTLKGSLNIPVFSVYPSGFYRLYSVSGLYLFFDRGKLSISNVKLSYIDGWFDVKDISLKGGVLSASISSHLGLKGILNRFGLLRYAVSVKGWLSLSGKLNYRERLQYRLFLHASNLSLRVSYALGNLRIGTVDARITEKGISSLFVEGSIADGNFVATGNGDRGFLVSLVNFPVGERAYWRATVTGDLLYRNGELQGDVNVSKAKLISLRRRGKTLELSISVNVNINFVEPFIVKTDIWSMEVLPKLKLKTLKGKVVIPGNYYVSSGWINYMGKKFVISYGSGTIENLTQLKGNINLIASSRISDYYVYMNVRGKMSSPSLYLSSDPPLTREQILNLITTGATPEEMERSSEIFPAVQVAYYVTSSFLKPFEKGFTRGLKLETFSLEPYITKYGETVVKLSVSKRLSKRFRVLGYQTTGQRPEYSAGIQLFLRRRFYLETRYNSYYGPETGIGFELNW